MIMTTMQYRTAFFVLLVLAAAIRMYGLGDNPYVLDEPFTANLSEERSRSMVNPIYYNLVVVSHKVFGADEFSTRLPAALLGILGVWAIGFTGRSLGGRSVAIVAMLLTTLSAWHLWHSQYARFYGGVFLFATLSYYYHYLALCKDEYKFLFISLAFGFVATLFHAMGIVVLGVTGLCSVVWLASKPEKSKVAKLHVGVGLIMVLGLAIPLYNLASEWKGLGQNWGASPFKLLFRIARDSGVVVFVAGVLGIYFTVIKNKLLGILLGLAIGAPIVIVLAASLFLPIRTDYIIYILPAIFLSVAFLIDHIAQSSAKSVAGLAVLVVVLAGMFADTATFFSQKNSFDVREAVTVVESGLGDKDVVLSHYSSFAYYSAGRFKVEPWIGTVEYNRSGWHDALEYYAQRYDTFWIVLAVQRTPHEYELENWILENAKLVYRKNSTRYDNKIDGIEIFRSTPSDRANEDND